MKNTEITSHDELISRIIYLKADKQMQEESLKIKFRDFASNLDFGFLLNNDGNKAVASNNIVYNLVKVVLNKGANFIIDKFLGKNRSFKGFLSSLLVEELSTLLINSNINSIISGFSRLIHSRSNTQSSRT